MTVFLHIKPSVSYYVQNQPVNENMLSVEMIESKMCKHLGTYYDMCGDWTQTGTNSEVCQGQAALPRPRSADKTGQWLNSNGKETADRSRLSADAYRRQMCMYYVYAII